MNNCIAVNSIHADNATVAGNSAALLHLANLIGHAVHHGMQRCLSNSVSTHSAHKVLVSGAFTPYPQKAGERFETSLWCGYLPRWWAPDFPEKANLLARQILVELRTTGDLPACSAEMMAQLTMAVGYRPPRRFQMSGRGLSSGVMFYEEVYFL
jgi:hypothetical protein